MTTLPGTRWRRPAPLCVALALAAHAVLLLGLLPSPEGTSHGHAGALGAVTARTVTVVPAHPGPVADASPAETPLPPALEAAPAREVTDMAASAAPPVADASAAASATPPSFEAHALPALDHPDAALPDAGVRLRVFVEVDARGSPVDVVVGSPPGEAPAPPAFQKTAARALRQAQFKPGSDPAYCFLVRFEAGTPAPQLAWLPGAARDAARCLTGNQPPPREMATAAAP